MGDAGHQTHFKTLQHFQVEFSPSKLTQYESERTGMRVVVIDQEGPKLHGYFVLATEIHDDSGAPHTLEHLCFMGSKSYRYKGFLDKLATRAYSGTNAWTATDHTAYTLDTAGWKGFAQILPIYLEHVISPTLTDAGCITEVHHVDGSGNDAGVVYSEMQGVQNTASELIELHVKRLLYPEGVGFRYETGGMMEQLRVLTADRIREFHRDMYQPKNLCLILAGEIDHEELLNVLDTFESTILDDIPRPDAPFKRPWVESKQTPHLTKTTIDTVEFPEEDESFGQIEIRFLGPDCNDDLSMAALNVVTLYLAGSSASVLDNTLVEKEQVTSGVYYSVDSRPKSEIQFSLTSVETGKLGEVEQRFFEVLKDAMAKDLDMQFMKECIERQIRSWKFQAEASVSVFTDYVIADFLFGSKDGSTLKKISALEQYDILMNWEQEQWREFIKKWISDAEHVSVLGKPSAAMSERLKADEEKRVEEQKARLGQEGLKRMQEKLDAAKTENDKEIPPALLARFKVPPTDSIHFVDTTTARAGSALKEGKPNNKLQKIIDEDAKEVPMYLHYEHIPSNFAQISLLISTKSLPIELLPLLSIYLESFFVLPIRRNGEVVEFEKVITELDRDTVGYGIDSGLRLGSIENIRISIQVEIEKYDIAINWLKELIWDSVFAVDRIMAVTARLLADVPDSKRSGDDMLTAVHLMSHLSKESIGRARSTLVKALYLKRIKSLLKNEPDKVIANLEKLRSLLGQFDNFRVLVISDLERLKYPASAWKPFFSDLDVSQPLKPLALRRERLSDAGLHTGKLAYIVPMPTIDSSYAYCTTRGPISYDDPVLPKLMVAMSYFNAVEGPLWVAVRGTGLAYGTSMSYDIESGFLHLDVYRSPEAYKAIAASKKIVEDHMNGTVEFDPLMLEGAISTIVVKFANEQQTLASAAQASFVRQAVRHLPTDFMQQMLKKVKDVTVDEIKDVLKNLIFDMFTPGKADVIVTCAPGLKDVSSTLPLCEARG